VPVGNLMIRLVGVALALPFLQPIAGLFARLDPNTTRMIADFHTAFNVVLALAFVFLLDALAALLTWLFPEPAKRAEPSAPLYLDEAAIQTPSVSLACAARETLHMGDVVEDMLRKTMTALMTNDRKLAAEVSRMDNIVDRLDEAIKLYVTKLTRESLDDRDGRRATEIISFAINLEHIGDIVDKNLRARERSKSLLPVARAACYPCGDRHADSKMEWCVSFHQQRTYGPKYLPPLCAMYGRRPQCKGKESDLSRNDTGAAMYPAS
jgi:phosphate:Na+ symporter